MGIVLLIGAAIAIGIGATIAVYYTIKWLKNRIKQKFEKQNVKKVAATTLEKLVNECPNEISLDNLLNDGYTDVVVSINNSGEVEDLDVIKNTGSSDPEIERLLGSEEMIVVTR